MKKQILSIIAAVFALSSATAQVSTSYFMPGSIQRYDLNAALTPARGYIAVPIADIGMGIRTNFLRADNFFYPNPSGEGVVTYMHSSVSADSFLGKLPNLNTFELSANDRLFGIGNYTNRGFWSLNVSLRTETELDIPKDFFRLTKTLSEGTYDIKGLKLETNNYVEAALGYVFPIQDAFTLGVRLKALIGIAHASVNIDKLSITVGEEEYRADMSGTLETNVQGYSFEGLSGEISMDDYLNHVKNYSTNFSKSNIGSMGFAIDAGLEWSLMDDQLHLSAGVNDLGYNIWSQKSSFCATIDNLSFAFKGYDFENNKVDFEKPDEIKLKTTEAQSLKKSLNTSCVVGGEYNTFNDRLGVGVVWTMKKYSSHVYNQLTASVNYRPTSWLAASLSHSFVNNQFGVMGLAVNLHPSLTNIFVGVDYVACKYGTMKSGAIPIPLNQNSFNLSFGMAIPLGSRSF